MSNPSIRRGQRREAEQDAQAPRAPRRGRRRRDRSGTGTPARRCAWPGRPGPVRSPRFGTTIADPRPSRCPSQASSALGLGQICRDVDLGRRVVLLVELLERRLQHLAASPPGRRSPSPPAATPPAASVQDRPARPPGRGAAGRPGWRHQPARASPPRRRARRGPPSPSSAGDRAASPACARASRSWPPPARTARPRRPRASASVELLDQLVVAPLEEQPRVGDRLAGTGRRRTGSPRTARCTA